MSSSTNAKHRFLTRLQGTEGESVVHMNKVVGLFSLQVMQKYSITKEQTSYSKFKVDL